VVLYFGKVSGKETEQGIRWQFPIGRELRRLSTRDTTLDIPITTVVEKSGNPIQISAVVVYRIQDVMKAAIDVADPHRFLADQAGAVVKRVASRFPYESPKHDEPCLRKESGQVSAELRAELQKAVQQAGLHVESVRLNDLTYAPEIAQAMLMRQQAMALVDARKTIVEGAVEIVKDAVVRLERSGFKLERSQLEQLISNLLVVICSGEHTQPVVQVQAYRGGQA